MFYTDSPNNIATKVRSNRFFGECVGGPIYEIRMFILCFNFKLSKIRVKKKDCETQWSYLPNGFQLPVVLWRNGLKVSSQTWLFFIFAKFLPYLMNFSKRSIPKAMLWNSENHQIWQNFCKKWRKAMFNLG